MTSLGLLLALLSIARPRDTVAWGSWSHVAHLQPQLPAPAHVFPDSALAQQHPGHAPVIRLGPTENLQAALVAHPAGTTFVLAAGMYRLDGETNMQMGLQLRPNTTLVSEEPRRAVLSGSRLVSAQQQHVGGEWTINGLYGLYNQSLGVCDPFHPACNLSQELFHNGTRIKRLQSPADISGGDEVFAWALDYATGIATLGFNPAGAPLEVSVVMTAVSGNCLGGPCVGINVSGLVFEHFANPAQIMPTEGAEIVEGCEVRSCHGTGIGSRVMARNYVHHNGELGLGRDGGCTHSLTRTSLCSPLVDWTCSARKALAWCLTPLHVLGVHAVLHVAQ